MKLCLSQATICGTPTLTALESAAHAGFGHFDLWWPKVHDETEPFGPAALAEKCAAENIVPAALSGVNSELAVDDAAWGASLADFRAAIAFARAAGIPLICFEPGKTSEIRPDQVFSLAARRLTELVDIAAEASVELALEFRADSGWLTTLPTALALVSIFDPQRLGICFDAYHYYCGPSKLEDLTPDAIGRIRSVQLSDLIATPREFAQESDRILPGEGDFDLRSLVGCFRSADYDGLICVESPNSMLWQFAPDRVADMAHQSLLRFFVTDDTGTAT
ncbi:TIM barrel protein [bacterium]|nr:TIM barrel protein [bacterium]